MRTPLLFICLIAQLAACSGDASGDGKFGRGDTGSTTDDSGQTTSPDAGSDTTEGGDGSGPNSGYDNIFPEPVLRTASGLPIRIEHLAGHPLGWAVAGKPVPGATIEGVALDGRFALGLLDEDGEFVWAKPIGVADDQSKLTSIAVDEAGAIYVALVATTSSVDFGNGVIEGGDPDDSLPSGFVAKYGQNGNGEWATGFWSDDGVTDLVVAARGDHVAAAGTYQLDGPLSYRGPAGVVERPSFGLGARTAFVVRLEPGNGQSRWLHAYGSASDGVTAGDVDVFDDGSIIAAGDFAADVVRDPDGSALVDGALPGGYMARYEPNGTLMWFTPYAERLQVSTDGDDENEVFLTGKFTEGVQIGMGDVAGPGIFVADVDRDGRVRDGWARSGSTGVLTMVSEASDFYALIEPDTRPTRDADYPPTRYALAMGWIGQTHWLRDFPSHVSPNAIAVKGGVVAIGGEFSGEHDFGSGTIRADSSLGFFVTY